MSIMLSKRHGLNPSIGKCFVCGQAHEVILFGRLPEDVEAPREVVVDRRPCSECRKWMAKGIILISVRDGESGDNPYRTGGWAVVTEAAILRIFQGSSSTVDAVLKSRISFLEDKVWNLIGLPRIKQND